MVTAAEQKNNKLRELMRQSLVGDEKSYQQLLMMVAEIVRIVVVKKIPQAEVEDVIQEILISVHKARHTYDCERPMIPWLMSIASFRINDYLRKHYNQMRHKTSDIEELVDILSDVTEEQNNNELLDSIFAELDQKQKQILTMMHVEGYTAKEVGKSIGMSESAIKVAAHRTIKKIKQKFAKK